MKSTPQLSAVLLLSGALAFTAGCNAPRQPTITQGVFGELISGGQKVQWNFTAGPGGGRWTKVN